MSHVIFFIFFLSLIGCTSLTRNTTSLGDRSDEKRETVILPAHHPDLAACEAFQKTLPPKLKRGFVRSVEKINHRERTVNIFFYGKWRKSPLIIANGGPGSSSWSTYESLKAALDRENIDYLFFDQRSTGCSSPYPPFADEYFPIWQKHYSSKGLASDIELLRTELKLGDKISVFGHSFGSKIAIRYGIDFPHSTHSILFFGDSFVDSEATIVRGLVDTLNQQQGFLRRRLVENSLLESTLRSLEKKFYDKPCLTYENKFVSVCGYDLIRYLGHYYNETSFHRIENLLLNLNKPEMSEMTFHEIIFKYDRRAIDPTALLLYFLDYRMLVGDRASCDLASEQVQIPTWALASCSMAKYTAPFLNRISKWLHPELLTPEIVSAALVQHPEINFYSLQGVNDLLTSPSDSVQLPKNWKVYRFDDTGHSDFFKSTEFWKVLKASILRP